MPPWPGAFAYRATGDERAKALYFDQMEHKVAAGLGRDGDPIYLNLEFLDGTRGGHVSISGISGVATKTSFALFLLYSIFTGGALGRRALNAKALVFSVKGEDLLFLDHANRKLRRATCGPPTRRSGSTAAPFASVGFFAPPTPDDLDRPPARHRPHQRGQRVLVDARGVLLRRAAALRLRRRRGRAQPVHDGHPPGRGPAAAGGGRHRARRGGDGRGTAAAHLRRPDRVPLRPARPTRTPAATGRARSPARARSTRSCAGCARSLKPLRSIVRGDLAVVRAAGW